MKTFRELVLTEAAPAKKREINDYLDIGHHGHSPFQLYFFDGTTRKMYVSKVREKKDNLRYDHIHFIGEIGINRNFPSSDISGRYETQTGLLSIGLGSDYERKGKKIPVKFVEKLIDIFPNIKEIYVTTWSGGVKKVTFSELLNESIYDNLRYFSMWWKHGDSEPLYMWGNSEEHSEAIVRLAPNLFTGAYEKAKEDPYYWKQINSRAIRNGYIRVGKFDTSIHGKELFIQFDSRIKGIWKTIFKILKWMDIDNDEKVLLVFGPNTDGFSELMTKAEAMRLATAHNEKMRKTAVS
jgi:hypothetical protein